MRVHELAKATQIESKDIIAIAKKHRIAIKPSPSANVEDKDIRKMMPYIDKFKSERVAEEAVSRQAKEAERAKKDEERRRKDEERRKKDSEEKAKVAKDAAKDVEAKKKTAADDKKKAETAQKAEAKKVADEAKRQRDQQNKMIREEEARRRSEDDRLRSLGLPVPKRPVGFRPRIAPPTPPPPPVQETAPEAPKQVSPAPTKPASAPAPAPAGQQAPSSPAPTSSTPQAAPAPRPAPRPSAAPHSGAPRPAGTSQGGPRPQYQGDRPQGDRPYGDRPPRKDGQGGPGGGRPYGDRPQGDRPPRRDGQQFGGPRPQGDRPYGDRPPRRDGQGGPRPQGGPGGGRPYGDRPQGDRPPRRDGQQFGGPRPQGDRPYGDRPPRRDGQGGPRPQGGPGGGRPYGDRPQGDRPPRRDGQQFGGPRPQGDRPYGDRPPRRDGQGRPQGDGRAPQLTEANLPQIGIMRIDKTASRRGEKRTPPPDKKRGKVAPRKIFELDEDMTVTSKPKSAFKPKAPVPGGGGGAFGGPRRFGSKKGGRKPQRSGSFNQVDLGPRTVSLESIQTVSEFAEKIGVAPSEVIKRVLLEMGEALTMNAQLSEEYMELLAPDFNVELEIIKVGDEYDVASYISEGTEENMQRRPPVVTIMGHVDHGKTSLLDYVRNSNVVSGEFGGITQHIGAYLVHTAKGDIVFLDTPGHEAFTSMRARGAGVTDLVILVVAANDGFKPQTIEALNHAQAAGVPIVVAVNKIDLPAADPAKVRQEALQHNLIDEALGGDTIFVDISAKKGTNVDQLLEMVALQSEILDLKADPTIPAQGIVIESHLESARGAVATVLIQRGTLHAGEAFVTGNISGRVRAMNNDRGKAIKIAGPAHPVEITGLSATPPAGETFLVMPDEQVARKVAEKRDIRRRATSLSPTTNKHITLEHLHEFIEEGKTKDLNLIIKADVQGSIEAVRQSLEKLSNEQIRIRVLHSAAGGVNESDVNLAAASDAIIIGFNVRPDQKATDLATQEGVDIKLYRIIYDLIDEVRSAMVGMLAPTFREKVLGHAEVRQTFRASKIGVIAGSMVRDGEIVRDSKVRVLRDNVIVYEGVINSIRRVKDDVKRVTTGFECGITIANFNDVKEGDILEAFEMEQVAATLAPPSDK